MDSLHFFVDRSPYRRHLGLYLSVENGDKVRIPESIVWKEVEEGSYFEPMLRITELQGQELMDALWAAGLRPTEGAGSAGAMSAVQAHLADMRRLVFDDRVEVRGGPGPVSFHLPMDDARG